MSGEQAGISRVKRSKAEAQASYDRISRWYDVLEGNWESAARRAGLETLDLQPGETVLEIGPGTGHSLAAIAQALGPGGTAYALDLSPRMARVAWQRLQSAGLPNQAFLACGDGAYLPYAGGVFDAIFMSFVLELFDTPEIALVLAGCRRVLKSGGCVCVVAMSREGGLNGISRLYEWGHGHFPALLDCRPIYPQRALQEAGLHVATVTRLSLYGLPVDVVVGVKGD
jgi:ubiquinone/menaquinone biosynthesis C-methylase UbiE